VQIKGFCVEKIGNNEDDGCDRSQVSSWDDKDGFAGVFNFRTNSDS
jgi:hypothetical protein